MKRWKTFAIFFTLLFIGSMIHTFYLLFSASEKGDPGRGALIIYSIVFNLVLLFLAYRSWRKMLQQNK